MLSLCSQIVDVGLKPPRSAGKFGLPGVPVLIRDQVDEELPTDFDVIFSVRLVVAEAESINIVIPSAWHTMNEGGEMVIIPGRHANAWPRLQEIQVEPTDEEKEGKKSHKSSCW